jgi:hypothetical protein
MLAESALLVAALIALFIVVIVLRSDRIIRQGSVAVVERLGRYSSTKQPGLCILMPFTDRIRLRVDVRQQVVSFPPQPVITQDKDAPAWGRLRVRVAVGLVLPPRIRIARGAVVEAAVSSPRRERGRRPALTDQAPLIRRESAGHRHGPCFGHPHVEWSRVCGLVVDLWPAK